MTGEEMERAIEFLLQSQASFENRLTAYDERLAQTQKQVGVLVETQNEFTQIVTAAVQNLTSAQTRTDDRLDKSDERLAQTQKQVGVLVETQNEFTQIVRIAVQSLTSAQTRTDDRLDKLAATVERFVSESRNG